MIQSLSQRNFLTYLDTTIKLNKLNIVIGGNGVGKSNLIKSFSILKSLPSDLSPTLQSFGGLSALCSKLKSPNEDSFELSVELGKSGYGWTQDLIYSIKIGSTGMNYSVLSEKLENREPWLGHKKSYYFFNLENGYGRIKFRKFPSDQKENQDTELSDNEFDDRLTPENFDNRQSILSQVKGPRVYTEIADARKIFEDIGIYGRWDTSREGKLRGVQSTMSTPRTLNSDGSNLGLILSSLEKQNVVWEIENWMKRFIPRLKRISTSALGNELVIIFSEENFNVTAAGVSDGTLQFLALLCVLLNPTPPPLICIEEPEISLHPDAITLLAELLREASEKTQLIVTTHSDRLVNAFTDSPENVLIADRNQSTGETEFKRYDTPDLKNWINKYGLGELWTSGEVGGTTY